MKLKSSIKIFFLTIQWYQQAKETYQKLGKRQYQEAIEAKIQKL